jgi:hypothetical protein
MMAKARRATTTITMMVTTATMAMVRGKGLVG